MMKLYIKFLWMLFFIGTGSLYAQTSEQKAKIVENYNQQGLKEMQNDFKAKAESQRREVELMAKIRNIPIIIQEEGRYSELQRFTLDGSPIYFTTYNVDAARSTRTDHLNSGGSLGLNLNGQNMTAYVWDGGLARTTHQEYDGAGGNNRFSIGDGSSTLNYHAAHVTGTIIASGVTANAKGMAPHAKAIGHDWNSDLSEATSAASNGMLLSNHSYGYRSDVVPDFFFGAYITESRDWDAVMYNAPYYLMVVAAGNDGNSNFNGVPLQAEYDKLTGHSTSKNNLVVANAQDANIDSNGNLVSVSISATSSEGPTDDLRIKPDITGNGSGVYSTYHSSDTQYGTISGTSMASPNVTGSLLLLQQHYNNLNNNFMRSATLKGLALHTADDAGSNGPDPVFGWGLLNAKRAAETITDNGNGSQISELTLSSGQTYQITVNADGVNKLMASISWTDPAGTATSATNSSTPVLVNDLDLRIIKNGATYLPWKLTGVTTNGLGDNVVDPYERAEVNNASGSYTLIVSHKGSLSSGSQNFSLIITGISNSLVVCNATTPTNVSVSEITTSSASVAWDSVTDTTYDVRYRATGTSSWTTQAVSETTYALNGLSAATEYEVQVRSKCDDGSNSAYSSSQIFTTLENQLNYCSSASNNVNDEYIGNVNLNTINNSSGAQFYTDFTSISTDLSKGNTYTITVTPTWTGTIYSEGYAVWIDYNHDGDFEDSGELVWSKAASTTTPVSGSFTVPSSATETATRMRVSMKYNGIPSSCESFTYGEVEDYTVNILANTGDVQVPSAPTNLAASNVTQTTLDLSWNASTDNVGVASYDIYMDGNLIGNVTETSESISGLIASTTYQFYVLAKDAAGNISSASNTVSVTTSSNSGGEPITEVVHEGFFESGWDGWTDGGSDCYRYLGYRSYEGYYSIRIRDNSGTSSAMTSPEFDLSAYDTVDVTFHFYPNSMENGEDFWLRYYNGSSWSTIATWASGTDFNNNSFYTATVTLSASQFDFADNSRFRFQCDAGGNADRIYIDAVKITGHAGANDVMAIQNGGSLQPLHSIVDSDNAELDFVLYPNPSKDVVTVDLGVDVEDQPIDVVISVKDMSGRNVMTQVFKNIEDERFMKTLNVSSLKTGVYIIEVTSDNGMLETQKLIVK